MLKYLLVYRIFSLLTIISLLVSPINPHLTTAYAQESIKIDRRAESTLFRTPVTLRRPCDYARLTDLGVVMLTTQTHSDHETALILADNDW